MPRKPEHTVPGSCKLQPQSSLYKDTSSDIRLTDGNVIQRIQRLVSPPYCAPRFRTTSTRPFVTAALPLPPSHLQTAVPSAGTPNLRCCTSPQKCLPRCYSHMYLVPLSLSQREPESSLRMRDRRWCPHECLVITSATISCSKSVAA
jgi:hypothetical protein